MKISVVCPNLSQNSTGRAWLLGKILERNHKVEIIGPLWQSELWPPLAGDPMRFVPVEVNPLSGLRRLARLVGERIDGDLIYACKPLPSSFGPAFYARKRLGVPLIADVDDWELGLVTGNPVRLNIFGKMERLYLNVFHPFRTLTKYNAWYFDRLVKRADALTVSNRYLMERYGGEMVRHVRDTAWLDPSLHDGSLLRRELGFSDTARVVLFLGTFRPHKGVDKLIEAVGGIADADVHLLLVGHGSQRYVSELRLHGASSLGERFHMAGPQPLERLPRFLALADVVVIPQEANAASVGQMPAKIFDAMAMCKPVVVTNVSDLAEVVGDGGWVVPPGDAGAMRLAIQEALRDPAEARKRGAIARERCQRHYSFDAASATLESVIARVMARSS